MKIKEMIEEMAQSGFSQAKIAKLVVKRGVSCTQPTIFRMSKAENRKSHDLAKAIEEIHAEFKNGTLIDVLVQ